MARKIKKISADAATKAIAAVKRVKLLFAIKLSFNPGLLRFR